MIEPTAADREKAEKIIMDYDGPKYSVFAHEAAVISDMLLCKKEKIALALASERQAAQLDLLADPKLQEKIEKYIKAAEEGQREADARIAEDLQTSLDTNTNYVEALRKCHKAIRATDGGGSK